MLAEELSNGMALRNDSTRAAWLQNKKREDHHCSAEAAGEEALATTWLPRVSIPHVLCAIPYPLHAKRPRLSIWKNKRIVT